MRTQKTWGRIFEAQWSQWLLTPWLSDLTTCPQSRCFQRDSPSQSTGIAPGHWRLHSPSNELVVGRGEAKVTWVPGYPGFWEAPKLIKLDQHQVKTENHWQHPWDKFSADDHFNHFIDLSEFSESQGTDPGCLLCLLCLLWLLSCRLLGESGSRGSGRGMAPRVAFSGNTTAWKIKTHARRAQRNLPIVAACACESASNLEMVDQRCALHMRVLKGCSDGTSKSFDVMNTS